MSLLDDECKPESGDRGEGNDSLSWRKMYPCSPYILLSTSKCIFREAKHGAHSNTLLFLQELR